MDDEKLIELVRQYPVLYDLSHPKYMNTVAKYDIWIKIGKEIKVNVAVCKARWNNIRDTYRKSLKKNITKSGQSAKKVKVYKYSEQLGFLKKYFEERDSKGNIDSEEEEEEHEEEVEELNESELINVEANNEKTEKNASSQEEENLSSQISSEVKKKCSAATKSSMKRKTKQKIIPQQSASSQLMDYLIKTKENQPGISTVHPVDTFLAGIATTLKTLDAYNLNLAKSEIFAITQKYEMQMILNPLQRQSAQQYNIMASTTNSSHYSDISVTSTPLMSPCEQGENQQYDTAPSQDKQQTCNNRAPQIMDTFLQTL